MAVVTDDDAAGLADGRTQVAVLGPRPEAALTEGADFAKGGTTEAGAVGEAAALATEGSEPASLTEASLVEVGDALQVGADDAGLAEATVLDPGATPAPAEVFAGVVGGGPARRPLPVPLRRRRVEAVEFAGLREAVRVERVAVARSPWQDDDALVLALAGGIELA